MRDNHSCLKFERKENKSTVLLHRIKSRCAKGTANLVQIRQKFELS